MTSCGIFPSGDFRSGSGTKATTVRVRSRSLEMALLVFDRSHTSSCNYGDFVSFASDLLVKNSEIFIPYL